MRRPGLVWAALLGGMAALDVYCDRNTTTGDTLSEVTRATFRTHHPLGRAAFVLCWARLSWWFVPHICRQAEASSLRLLDDWSGPSAVG